MGDIGLLTMSLEREPAPIHRRRRQPEPSAPSSDGFIVAEYLFWSLIAGPGVMASVSAAAFLQFVWPDWRFYEFPLAGLVGLLFGWVMTVPFARWFARRVDPVRAGLVALVTVILGLMWAAPAAFCASSIGWQGGAARMFVLAATLSASGLIWGGYLNFDAEEE